jgi:hypothetical protein
MNKTREQHLENMRKKFSREFDLSFPSDSVPYKSRGDQMFEFIWELLNYDTRPGPELAALRQILHLTDPLSIKNFTTNFGFFQKASADTMGSHQLNPVTSSYVLENGKYGDLWGIAWHVSREVPNNEIWVFSGGFLGAHKTFILKDDGVYIRETKLVETKL